MDCRFHKELAQDPPALVKSAMRMGLQKRQGRSKSASGTDTDKAPQELPDMPSIETILDSLADLRIPGEIANKSAEVLAKKTGKSVESVFGELDKLSRKYQELGTHLGQTLGYLVSLDGLKTSDRRQEAIFDMAKVFKLTWPLQSKIDEIVESLQEGK